MRRTPLPGMVSSSRSPNRTCEFPCIRLSMRARAPRVATAYGQGGPRASQNLCGCHAGTSSSSFHPFGMLVPRSG